MIGISIIIPVYNAEKYLKYCFKTLDDQTFRDFEVVFVNDGSTDGSLQLIEDYVKDKENCKVYSKENGGQSSARNLALTKISGEYIIFLDCDDYLDNDYLEVLYSTAKKNHSDVVISGQKKVDEEGHVLEAIIYDVERYPSCILRRLNFSGKIYRREYLIEKHHMQFAVGKTYEDNPFNLVMLFLAKNLQVLSYAGYYQVVHQGSTTTKKIVEEKLPLPELKKTVQYVLSHEEEINDRDLFEYTLMSFLTYFLFQANKKHMYLSLDDRQSDLEIILKVSSFSRKLLSEYMPKYWKNKYLKVFKYRELKLAQRFGVLVFATLCRFDCLNWFVKLYYHVR